MNPFAVEWEPTALNGLANVWMLAPDRQAVTAASSTADLLLAREPIGNGALIQTGLYRLRIPPLGVIYSVDEVQQVVRVWSVWQIS